MRTTVDDQGSRGIIGQGSPVTGAIRRGLATLTIVKTIGIDLVTHPVEHRTRLGISSVGPVACLDAAAIMGVGPADAEPVRG